MKKVVLLIYLKLSFGFAQVSNNSYLPIQSKSEEKTSVSTAIYRQTEKDLTTLVGKNRSDYKEIYKERADYVLKDLHENRFIFGSLFNIKLQYIVDEILLKNKNISSNNLRILLSRSSLPNAVCLGEGTIIVNLGLFRHIENDSQLAFILCHELAHLKLNHVNNSIDEQIKMNNDEELKNLSKQKYNVRSKAFAIFKESLYNWGKHSRNHEKEADSLGFVLLKNTIYDVSESVKSLDILDKSDDDNYAKEFDFDKIFNSQTKIFNNNWLNEPTSSLSIFTKESEKILDEDSLKTHPDCKNRIEFLKGRFGISEVNNKGVKNLETLKAIADFEVIESDYLEEKYIRSLYRTIGLLHKYPQNTFLKTALIRNLSAIHYLQKNHLLSKIPTNNIRDNNLKRTYRFINNISLSELVNLSSGYFESIQNSTNEDSLYAHFLINSMKENEIQKQELYTNYLNKYPSGKYINDLKQQSTNEKKH